jgi:hypothetical protein
VNGDGFMAALRTAFPELAPELDDETWRGLLHIETGCFARYTQDAIDRQDQQEVARCTEFALVAWSQGSSEVQNALGVSFLEHLNFADGKKPRQWAFDVIRGPLRDAAIGLGINAGYRRG